MLPAVIEEAPMQTGRRTFIKHALAGGVTLTGLAGILHSRQAPAAIASDSLRPMAPWGLQIGDVVGDRAIVWSRADKPARMFVEWSRDENFANAAVLRGPHALDASDLTARIDLTNLPAESDVFVRVLFEDLDSGKARSEPVVGRLRTPPAKRRDIRFVWSGDTAGQGWGIDLDFGGMKIYESMRRARPDFFIHSGDTIYADGPLQERVTDATGKLIWTNAFLDVVPEKLKVAESLQEYRRNHLYNRYDVNVQRFSAEVPQIWQWDDHEVTNNWSDSKVLDNRYAEQRIQTLVGRATRAFLEYSPMRWHNLAESERVYRHIPYGRDLDVFVLDMRSYRGPNTFNRQEQRGAETAFLGRAQLAWLKAKLDQSRATWKIIASDMPLGLQIGDGTDAQGRPRWEGPANGRRRGARTRVRARRHPALHQARGDPQRRVAHCRRALLRGALLRSEPRAVPGFRTVLGIRRRAAARRQLRPEPARQHLRPASRVPEGTAGREHAAQRRLPVLRTDRHRPAQQASHCDAEGHRRRDGVHQATRCENRTARRVGLTLRAQRADSQFHHAPVRVRDSRRA